MPTGLSGLLSAARSRSRERREERQSSPFVVRKRDGFRSAIVHKVLRLPRSSIQPLRQPDWVQIIMHDLALPDPPKQYRPNELECTYMYYLGIALEREAHDWVERIPSLSSSHIQGDFIRSAMEPLKDAVTIDDKSTLDGRANLLKSENEFLSAIHAHGRGWARKRNFLLNYAHWRTKKNHNFIAFLRELFNGEPNPATQAKYRKDVNLIEDIIYKAYKQDVQAEWKTNPWAGVLVSQTMLGLLAEVHEKYSLEASRQFEEDRARQAEQRRQSSQRERDRREQRSREQDPGPVTADEYQQFLY